MDKSLSEKHSTAGVFFLVLIAGATSFCLAVAMPSLSDKCFVTLVDEWPERSTVEMILDALHDSTDAALLLQNTVHVFPLTPRSMNLHHIEFLVQLINQSTV